MKPLSKAKDDVVPAEADFPKSAASVSARKSFAREMARLRSLSVEERIAEALSLHDVFSWLEPAAKIKDV